MAARHWLLSGGASLVAHGALFAGLGLTLVPKPVDQQEVPKSQLTVTSYQVDQSEAAAKTLEGDAAQEQEPAAPRMGEGTIARSKAAPADLPSDKVSSQALEMAALAPATANAPAQSAAVPESNALLQSPMPTAPLVATTMPSENATPAAVSGPQVSATEPQVQAVAALSAAPDESKVLATSAIPSPALTPTETSQNTLADVPPKAPKIATLSADPAPVSSLAPDVAKTSEIKVESVMLTSAEPRVVALATLAAPEETTPAAAVAVPAQTAALADVTPSTAKIAALDADTDLVGSVAPDVAKTSEINAESVTLTSAKPTVVALATLAAPEQTTPAVAVVVPAQTAALADIVPIAAKPAASTSLLAPNLVVPNEPVAQSAAPQETVPSAQPASQMAPPQELPAEFATAALAWSGEAEGVVDPVSLAAIQAFMQPSDLGQNGAQNEVRDGIEAVLASVPCARLQTEFDPVTGQLQLRGHIPEDGLRAPVLDALRAQIGDAIPVQDTLLILPRPQCGALSGITNVGLPQSTDQITNPRVVGPQGFARNFSYSAGERLILELTAPDYPSVVYVDYFTADGQVLHLQPNEIVPLEAYPAKSPFTVGKDRGDKPSLNLTISPPFGQEIAVAFAASVPVYDGLRPISEPAEPYIKFLREQIAQIRARDPNFKGEWVYFFISAKAE